MGGAGGKPPVIPITLSLGVNGIVVVDVDGGIDAAWATSKRFAFSTC
jgi:hypothetical protein